MHGFAGQKLSNAGPQHSAPVAAARVGRRPCALQLQFLQAHRGVDGAQVQRTAITQLTGPLAKLVAAVNAGTGAHGRASVNHQVARQRV